MEIPAEVCGPRSVVREIHSAILRYFREIMKRMEVARGALRDERVLVVTLKKKKKRDATRITREPETAVGWMNAR